MEIQCDESLLRLLQQARPEEIDYLIDVITDFGSGRIALSSSVKDLLLDEKCIKNRYSENSLRFLINEFQGFGGHSVLNVFRSKRISYSEILNDVFKKLNGKNEKKNDTTKHHEIVLSLFGSDWKTLTISERYSRCTNPKVLSGLFQITDSLSLDPSGSTIGLSAAASAAVFTAARIGSRFTPWGVGATVVLGLNSAISEAYRITVPFTAQVAWIQMRIEHDKLLHDEKEAHQKMKQPRLQ